MPHLQDFPRPGTILEEEPEVEDVPATMEVETGSTANPWEGSPKDEEGKYLVE